MDISITAKHQTLAASSSSSFPICSRFHLPISIRREFLGCGAHTRPPGLRSRPRRRRRRRLGPRIQQSPTCSLLNSMDGDAVLVVAVAIASLATAQLIYMNYNRRRRDFSKLVDGQNVKETPSSELFKEDKDIVDEAVGNQATNSKNLCVKPFESDNVFVERFERSCHKEVYDYNVGDEKAVLAMEDILIDEEQHSYDITHFVTDNDLLKENKFVGLSLSSVKIGEVNAMERGDFAAKMPNSLSIKDSDVTVSNTPITIHEPSEDSFVISENDNSVKINYNKFELGENLISSTGRHKIGQPPKEIPNHKEGKQPAMQSISGHQNLSTKPHHLAVQGNTVFHSHREAAPTGANILVKSSLSSEGQTLIGCSREGPVRKENDITKLHGFTRNIGRTLKDKNNGDFSSFPQQIGFARGVSGTTAYLSTYNLHLKDGRLRDCLDLLEKMESKGLLDMDKVHHSRFLKLCKSQKAVKEAFQFCKLIANPSLSTFNMLLSVCASAQDFEGAFQAMLLVKEAGLRPDCKLYTTLISTCAKSGKVDAMFEVFHEMVNAGVEPNVNTYGALIDGCARAGQVAKAFGAYGILRSKKVQPDRVIFNALITACGQSGAVDRAFDVLAEMRAENKPIDPDHVTVGALMKTCMQAGQVDRVRDVYNMLQTYNIRGTPDVYTIAVRSCSQTGDLDFALSVYNDMKQRGVVPDEMFLSTIIDVAGHAGKVNTAFEILQDARRKGLRLGNVSYSSLMGACCNGKNWEKALELYVELKAIKLLPTVSTLNALITSLCDGDQLLKAVEVLDEIKEAGVRPNIVTYSILIVACEKKDEAELGFMLLSKSKKDGILPNLIMCRCLTGLCLKSLEKAHSLGQPIVTFNSGKPQIDSKWTTWAIMVYRETISAGVIPTIEVFSQVLGCLQFPRDSSSRNRFIENLGIQIDASKSSNICSLLDGFGEYDTQSFSVLEEAASLGVIPRVSFKDNPIVIDARKLLIHTVEVYILTILKALKHRLAAGARLPNITILLPVEKTQIDSSNGRKKTINVAGRIGQAVGSLLRRLGLKYSGDVSYGKIRINGLSLRRWFRPKHSDSSLSVRTGEMIPTPARLAKGISDQQRKIRSVNNMSLD